MLSLMLHRTEASDLWVIRVPGLCFVATAYITFGIAWP